MYDLATESFLATEAMTKYLAVKQGTAEGSCDLVDSVDDVVLGFVQDTVLAADAGERPVGVMTDGVTIAVADDAISVGDYVKVTASAKVLTTTTPGDVVCGIARTEAAADGDWLEIKIVRFQIDSDTILDEANQ